MISAERAALIYAMDPVYGAIFARLLVGDSETLGIQGVYGSMEGCMYTCTCVYILCMYVCVLFFEFNIIFFLKS